MAGLLGGSLLDMLLVSRRIPGAGETPDCSRGYEAPPAGIWRFVAVKLEHFAGAKVVQPFHALQ